MARTLLITGATDGIGRATAQRLAADGHTLLIHGRSAEKLAAASEALAARGATVRTFRADLKDLGQVAKLAREVREGHGRLDALINNAGVFKVARPLTEDGEDVRFLVNVFAPALLTRALLAVLPDDGRVVHLSSAAQAPVDLAALAGKRRLSDMDAYAQSKLALTMWSQAFAAAHPEGPVSVAVNPGSLLATNMVRAGFGVPGHDIEIGAEILVRASLSDDFANASGRYFDNDSGLFSRPHADASDPAKVRAVVGAIENRIAPYLEGPDV